MKAFILLSLPLIVVLPLGCNNTKPSSGTNLPAAAVATQVTPKMTKAPSYKTVELELRDKTGFHQRPLSDGKKTSHKLTTWPGKSVEIISIEDVPLQLSNQPVKSLTYRTKLPITMGQPLQTEMLEVWSRFTTDLTIEKAKMGMITAVKSQEKGDKSLMSYTRAYELKDGMWNLIIK